MAAFEEEAPRKPKNIMKKKHFLLISLNFAISMFASGEFFAKTALVL